jgi:hypothetical protein
MDIEMIRKTKRQMNNNNNQSSHLIPDIIANIKLYSKEDGGLNRAVHPLQIGFTFFYKKEYFDCRLLLDQLGVGLELGEYATVPIKFLHPEYLMQRLKPGQSFKLWRGKFIGDGKVVEVIDQKTQ